MSFNAPDIDKGNFAAKLSHPEDRRPKDSDALFNSIFNKSLELKTGIPNIRRKSVFVTGDKDQARRYGDVYYFLPIGKFKFVYSSDVKDSFEHAHKLWAQVAIAFGGHMAEFIQISPHPIKAEYFEQHAQFGWMLDDYSLKRIFSWLFFNEKWDTIEASLSDSQISSLGKIILQRIDLDKKHFDGGENTLQFLSKLHDILKAWWPLMHRLILTSFSASYEIGGDLEHAISSYTEILFYASEGYYIVSCDKLKDAYIQMNGPETNKMVRHAQVHFDDYQDDYLEYAKYYEWLINLGKTNGNSNQ